MKKLMCILLCLVLCLSLGACGGEKIVWDDIILGGMLPEPPANRGEVHYNSSEELWVDINDLSDKQFNDYISACKKRGFNIDAESNSSSYEAFNEEGYKLRLSHYGSDADMSIYLESPMEMATITWPTGIAGQQLPPPKSTIGKFSYEYDDNFFVYIGDTTKDDYAEYVNTCSEMGFNVDYSKGDEFYYANNSDGWHIDVRYVGNNVMSIHIEAPNEEKPNETTASPADSSAQASEPESKPTEEPEKDTSNDGGLDPNFKAAMDSYEAFIDEYVVFMKKYMANPGDLSLLADYAEYMNKYADFVEDFEKWENEDLNAAELAYYIEVQSRVSQKLLEVVS